MSMGTQQNFDPRTRPQMRRTRYGGKLMIRSTASTRSRRNITCTPWCRRGIFHAQRRRPHLLVMSHPSRLPFLRRWRNKYIKRYRQGIINPLRSNLPSITCAQSRQSIRLRLADWMLM